MMFRSARPLFLAALAAVVGNTGAWAIDPINPDPAAEVCKECSAGAPNRLTALAAKAAAPVAASKAEADHANMVWVPGGVFWMGTTDQRFQDARPVHQVWVDGFWIDRTTVTNAEFAKFVEATGYVTVAERKPDPAAYPGVPAEALVAGSVVFAKPEGPVSLRDPAQWWRYVAGADWRHPEGPQSDIKGREQHPVVQVAWEDASAYAKWAGKRLPTEAEFEFAARGGLDRKAFVWGDEFTPGGKYQANTFQGHFPDHNTAADGFTGTAPVGSFPANGYGLFDMAGNTWQWCADWYRPDLYAKRAESGAITVNPQGPTDSLDPEDAATPKRVQKGGSFLCTDQYCTRYMPGSRGKGEPSTGSNHVGFRCVAGAGISEVRFKVTPIESQ